MFFILAGFHFQIDTVGPLLVVGPMYILARSLGLLGGALFGAALVRAPRTVRTYTGWCLLPQAGLALGLALKAAEQYPRLGEQLLSIVVATTVVLEMAGPMIMRLALRRAGELDPEDRSLCGTLDEKTPSEPLP